MNNTLAEDILETYSSLLKQRVTIAANLTPEELTKVINFLMALRIDVSVGVL